VNVKYTYCGNPKKDEKMQIAPPSKFGAHFKVENTDYIHIGEKHTKVELINSGEGTPLPH
jgi:hypothetical protein